MGDLEQRIIDLKEIITSLNFCQENNKACKKCKKKDDCLKFIRSSIAVCLQLFVSELEGSDDVVPEYFV